MPDQPSPDLYVDRVGSGTAVLLLHGFGLDHRSMRALAEPAFRTRPGFERHYADLPGMGRSSAAGIHSTDDVVARLSDYLEAELPDRPVALVGQSFGGGVARALAALHRPRVLGLALVCPMVVADSDQRQLPPRTILARDDELVSGLAPADAAEFTDMAVVQDRVRWQRFSDEILPAVALADDEALARIRSRYALGVEPEQQDRPLDVPTLVVTGRQDHVAGYLDPWGLVEHYPRATFAVLDRAGHNVQHEQPELVTALVGEWLDRLQR